MPDIQLRFHKDMLVLSASYDAAFQQRGFDPARDVPYVCLMEPETVEDMVRLESLAGANRLVTPTAGITAARLAHARMADDAERIAHEAVRAVASQKPQHILAEIGPCGLPLDPTSKASLNEHRAQYAAAAHAFDHASIDALFVNGFTSIADLKCALMGVAQVSTIPVFASVDVKAGSLAGSGSAHAGETLAEAFETMIDLEADVIGFATAEAPAKAVEYARCANAFDAPVLAQLDVRKRDRKQHGPTDDNPYYCADACEAAAVELYGAGVQFLRATGQATAAYTGALSAVTKGLDVRQGLDVRGHA